MKFKLSEPLFVFSISPLDRCLPVLCALFGCLNTPGLWITWFCIFFNLLFVILWSRIFSTTPTSSLLIGFLSTTLSFWRGRVSSTFPPAASLRRLVKFGVTPSTVYGPLKRGASLGKSPSFLRRTMVPSLSGSSWIFFWLSWFLACVICFFSMFCRASGLVFTTSSSNSKFLPHRRLLALQAKFHRDLVPCRKQEQKERTPWRYLF